MPSAGIPVLMYHSLDPVKNYSSPAHSTTITVDSFEEQMGMLAHLGFHTISIDELLENTGIEKTKSIVITFDDGYFSTLKYAAPILRKYGFTATLFLPILPIGLSSFKNFDGFSSIQNDRPLSWEEVKSLQDQGWSVQSHTLSHSRLSFLAPEQIKDEVKKSKSALTEKLGKEIKYFAYPFGDYNRAALSEIANAGYKGAFTVHPGKAHSKNNKLRIPRIEINSLDTLPTFLRKVETGYISNKEKARSMLRDVLFYYPLVKDLIQRRV